MKNTIVLAPFTVLWVILTGCAPANSESQTDAIGPEKAKEVVQVLGKAVKLVKITMF